MRQLLAKHWDRLALGASLALVGVYLLAGGAAQASDPAVERLDGDIVALRQAIRGAPPAAHPETAYPRRVASAFGPATPAAPGLAWVCYKPTDVRVRVVEGPALPPAPLLSAPLVDRLDARVGRVELAWRDHPRSTAKTSGYAVYRRRAADRDFEKIADLPAREKAYTDERVKAKTEYVYAVGARTDQGDAVTEGGPGPKGEGPLSAPARVTTPRDADLVFSGMGRQEEGRLSSAASVTLRTFVNGRWVSKHLLARKGERVGPFEILDLVQVIRVRHGPAGPYDAPAWKLVCREADGELRELFKE